jgi:uncharacterized protein YbaR (Trm112 family)
MKHKLLDILACPTDSFFPLELSIFEENEEIISGILFCPKCLHWYPIRERIPEMFPDRQRDEEDELKFLNKWKEVAPQQVIKVGKPFNINNQLIKSKTKSFF